MPVEVNKMEEKWQMEVNKIAQESPDAFFSFFDGKGFDQKTQIARGQYDMVLHILRDPVLHYLKNTTEKTALEIGYGGGRLLASAVQHFKFVYGIDVHDSPALVEKMLDERCVHNYKLLKTDGRSIPVESETIDFVYSFIVLMHLGEFVIFDRYVSEIARVLRPGGIAQIYFARPFGWMTWKFSPGPLEKLARAFERLTEFFVVDLFGKGYREYPNDPLSTSLLVSYRKAKSVARKYGLEVLGTGSSYYKLPSDYPRLGTQRFLCLRKPA